MFALLVKRAAELADCQIPALPKKRSSIVW